MAEINGEKKKRLIMAIEQIYSRKYGRKIKVSEIKGA